MQLHGDAQTVIGLAHGEHQHSLIALDLLLGEHLTCHALAENGICLLHGDGTEGDNCLKAVVTGAAAPGMEVFDPLHQRIGNLPGRGQCRFANGCCQLADIIRKAVLVDVHGLVGAEGGADLNIDGGVGSDLVVPLQGVDGIIGGADEGNVCLADQTPGSHFRILLQKLVAVLPDSGGTFHGQRLGDTEELLQLQMAPVIHGITDGHFQSLGQLQKPLVGRLVTGNVFLGHAVGAHHAPLVVVAGQYTVRKTTQPDLHQIVEPAILVDLPGVQVAVVIRKRHVLRVIVEQVLCSFCF